MNVEQDGFFVDLTFVRRVGRSGKGGGKKGNPGRIVWEKIAKKKRCVIPIKNQEDDLCCARAIIIMREWSHCQEPKKSVEQFKTGSSTVRNFSGVVASTGRGG